MNIDTGPYPKEIEPMERINELRSQMTDPVKDLKLNLSSVLTQSQALSMPRKRGLLLFVRLTLFRMQT